MNYFDLALNGDLDSIHLEYKFEKSKFIKISNNLRNHIQNLQISFTKISFD